MNFTLIFKLLFLMCFLLGNASQADQGKTVSNMHAALIKWMDEQNVKNATLTIFHKDEILATFKDGADATDMFELASLSKSITGICTLHLIKLGRLNADTKLNAIFGDRLEKLDLNTTRNGDISISELLAQSSGLLPDSTQGRMKKWRNSKRDRHERVAGHALGRENQDGNMGTFSYNNENYAILGAVIEQVTGQGYMQYCRDAVLRPHGITSAGLSGEYGAYAAWGGWEISTQDFAKFLWAYYGPDGFYGGDPMAFPNVNVEGGAHYGAGSFVRESQVGYNFWHHGAICMGSVSQTGSFFAFWQGGWGVVVGYDKCPDWEMMLSLDVGLGKAAFGGR